MYEPKDFEKHKMHCLKYLWIFQRKTEIIREMISDSDDVILNEVMYGNNPDIFIEKIIEGLSYSKQVLQFNTGLNDKDLEEALKIGSVLAELIITSQLSEEERASYFDMIDDPTLLGDMESFRLKTIREKIESIYNGENIDTFGFDDIIARNFGEESNGEQEGS